MTDSNSAQQKVNPWQPIWGAEHDQIVAEYKKARAEGKINGLVLVPRG
jgi:hypothetical protein